MATLSLRMHVRQLRMAIWVGTAGLTVLAGWNLWEILRKFRARSYEARTATHFEELIGGERGSIDQGEVKLADWKDYTALTKCPINGYVPEAPAPPAKPVDDAGPPPEKPLTDVVTVTAVTSAPEDLGRVVVKYKDDTVRPSSRDEVVLRIGALLAAPYDREPFNGRLKAIGPDSATFDWCGKDVELHPMRKEEAAHRADAAVPVEKRNFDASLTAEERAQLEKHKTQEKTVSLTPDTFIVGTSDYNGFATNAENYLRDAKVTERKDASGKKEVVVGQIRPNSYLAQTYKIQADDALISINGTPVTTKASAYAYVRENDSLSKYVVVLRRRGREITRTILVNRDGKK